MLHGTRGLLNFLQCFLLLLELVHALIEILGHLFASVLLHSKLLFQLGNQALLVC